MDSFKLFLESTDVENLWRALEQAAKRKKFDSSDFNILADAIEEAGQDGTGLRWMAANNVWPIFATSDGHWYWYNSRTHPRESGRFQKSSAGYYHFELAESAMSKLWVSAFQANYAGRAGSIARLAFYSFRKAVEALLSLHPETTPGILPEPRRKVNG